MLDAIKKAYWVWKHFPVCYHVVLRETELSWVRSEESGDPLRFITAMGQMSTVGRIQFSGYDHSLPWSKPFHPLLSKSLHCEQPLVGEEEHVIFNFRHVCLSLTFAVWIWMVSALCVCRVGTGVVVEAAGKNPHDRTTAPFFHFTFSPLSLSLSVSPLFLCLSGFF